MTGLRAWFAERSLREQRLLLVMLALLALTIGWFGVIRPLGDGLASARARHTDAVIRLGETQARVDAIAALQRDRAAPLTGGLDAAVRVSADRAGFTLASLNQLGPGRVQIGIASARPAALNGWIAQLEDSGILVDMLGLTDNGDRTVAATITLVARAT